jgi:hypothetical protein
VVNGRCATPDEWPEVWSPLTTFAPVDMIIESCRRGTCFPTLYKFASNVLWFGYCLADNLPSVSGKLRFSKTREKGPLFTR